MDLGASAARALLYVGAVAALGRAGGCLFAGAWMAGTRRVHEARGPRALARVAALALAVAPLLLLQQQLAALEMSPADVRALLAQTTWGHGWSVLTAACVLTGVALVLPLRRATALGLLLASFATAVAMGGLGHAAADERWPAGARVLDAVHVIATGLWIGGLLDTLLITRVPGFSLRDLAWRTFSRTATVMAPAAVLTGVLSGVRVLGVMAPAVIVASDYGRLLALKTALVVVVLIIGARQRRRIQRGEMPGSRAVHVECAVAAAVMLVTAALTGSEPPAAD